MPTHSRVSATLIQYIGIVRSFLSFRTHPAATSSAGATCRLGSRNSRRGGDRRRANGGGPLAARKRLRIEPTDDRQQPRLRVRFPEQESYELLRPLVLLGQTAAERARATGVSERTLDRKADRFDAVGVRSPFDEPASPAHDRRRLPADLRHRILALQAEYPSLRPHEIATICRRRDDCRVSHKTVQRVLAEGPPPPLAKRRYPP